MMDLTQKQWVKHSVFHPFEGFEDLRWKKGGSVLYASIVVLLWFVAEIVHDNLVGYQFAVTNPKMFSIVSGLGHRQLVDLHPAGRRGYHKEHLYL